MVGCESPSATSPSATEVASLASVQDHPQNRGSVSTSITGSGSFTDGDGGDQQTFAFTALDQRTGDMDATVVGQFEVNRGSVGHRHGNITCFLIEGNQAFIGGQVFGLPGGVREYGFRVVDNGQGKNAPPDQISDLIRLTTIGLPNDAGAWCGPPAPLPAVLALVPLFDITVGNITVRNHPSSGP